MHNITIILSTLIAVTAGYNAIQLMRDHRPNWKTIALYWAIVTCYWAVRAFN